MKLIQDTNIVEFLHAVKDCRADVLFISPDGNRLSLKSQLSQYIFAVAVSDSALLADGEIFCEDGRDAGLLADYLEEG